MSQLKVNALVSYSGNTVTLGTSGDTITVPSGVTFNTASATVTLPTTIKVDTIQNTNSTNLITQTNVTTITFGATSQTISVPSVASFATTIGVGGATPSSSGAGITFPASVSASSDANTLDDYEEGTWTPSVGGNATYINRNGRYVKIGKQVSIQFEIRISTLGTGSTQIMSGLPFTSQDIGIVQTGCISYWANLAVNTIFIAFYVENNATTIKFVGKATSGATSDDSLALFGNSANIFGTATYYTN
jgi:hypothetical protein